MYTNSVLAIASVDLAVLVMAGWCLTALVGRRKFLSATLSTMGLICVGAGISIFGLFYLTDLVLVALVPQFASHEVAMGMLESRHPNVAWLAGAFGFVLMAWGFLIINQRAPARAKQERRGAFGAKNIMKLPRPVSLEEHMAAVRSAQKERQIPPQVAA